MKKELFKYPKSETVFYIGLFLGLVPLFVINTFINDFTLSIYANLYTILGILGGILSLYRFNKTKVENNFRPEFISISLLMWSLGQIVWMFGMFKLKREVPYPWYSDIPYLASMVFWNLALQRLIKPLKIKFLSAMSPLSGFYTFILGIVCSLVFYLNRNTISQSIQSNGLLQVILDFLYLFLASWGAFVAGVLFLSDKPKITLKVERCLRFLFFAALLNFLSQAAFIVTTKLPATDLLSYKNGNWVDFISFGSMLCWCISTTIYPKSFVELNYSFGYYGTKVIEVQDVFKAADIAEEIFHTEKIASSMQIDFENTSWIMKNIPETWRIIKEENKVIGSVLAIPLEKSDMEDFVGSKITEKELFESVKSQTDRTYEYLYLAGASILPEYRMRNLAFQSFVDLIESIKIRKNKEIKILCWPITFEGTQLSKKLKEYFVKENEFQIIEI